MLVQNGFFMKKNLVKKIRNFSSEHTNNWEVGILLTQSIISPIVDVPSPGYGWIYSILSNDKGYDVIIGNFPGCSHVRFVIMLVGFLGGRGGCMCNVNMCITSCRRLCSMGSFITTHGVGMKFNICWSVLKLFNSCDSTSKSHS
jgi:hypothetical protein